MVSGGLLLLAGIIWFFWGEKFRWIGHLPGDINIKRDNYQLYIPITTLVLVNLLLFIFMRIWNWLGW
ncbi:DUF2905 domain-containing protein [Mucilaginibacter aquatilis]|uniref:DUF2905 family protein n=1 Tax=Mucilaginibacter aquatilis TaxID=1517760 RepID=A0A6I4IBG9_9SPHI|nr:DUF2905 domain-containing protein [Mucilaginibacter aquatilis]MVN92541.1 DUF2905 family protein [Mucilaginibacter aquatilis]